MNAKTFINPFAVALSALLIVLSGCKKSEEPPAPAPSVAVQPPPKPAVVSAVKNSFEEVTSKLDKGGNLYLYVSTEQVMTNLTESVSALSNFVSTLPAIAGADRKTTDKIFSVLQVAIKQSGVSEISGLGMSSIAREPQLFYNKVVVHHYPGQNDGAIWSLFGKSPHPLAELDLLPETTALASSVDFDLPLLWTNIQLAARTLDVPEVNSALDQMPAKFKELTGLEWDAAVNSPAGEYGVILTLDQQKTVTIPLGLQSVEIPSPGLCLVFKVKSNLIFDRVDEVLKGNPLVTKVEEPDLKMRTMTIPLPIPLDLRPSLARVGDYLLLASSDNMIREIIAVKSGQKKGYKSTDEFKRLSQGIPSEGNNFSLVSGTFAGAISKFQEKQMGGQGMDTNAFKSFSHVFQTSTNNYSVAANGPDGWVGTGNGANQSAAVILLPIAASAGALAAIAIPNFVKARETAQKNTCINNLRMIQVAKQQWALDNKKQNTDIPTLEDLKTYLPKTPICPTGGIYTVGSVGEKPTCSQPGHELPE